MASKTSGTTIPGYTIIRTIGVGGSAEVYLAVQENLNRRVALKLVKGTLTSEPRFGERFEREGRIIAQLNHPNIIPVYDIGKYQGQYYMAMEYLDSGDLTANAMQMTLGDLLKALSQIAQALQVSHDRGFVHRDIKPANILFRKRGEAVLTDFGIARQTQSLTQMTVTGAMLGTPAYMSPEQINGHTLDGRADLYSLGVTLYEMLTGFQPYRGETMMSVAMQHTHSEIPPLPEETARLQSLIDRLMAKKAEDRLSNAQALKSELELLGQLKKPDFSAPLTSLWPDKTPDIESFSKYSTNVGKRPATGHKKRNSWLLAGTAILVLIAVAGVITRYVTITPAIIDADTISTNQIESNRPPVKDTAVTSDADQKPDIWREVLAQAEKLSQQGQLITPKDNNALALYRQVLQQDSANTIAKSGEQNILRRLILNVERLIVNQSPDEANRQLAVLASLWPQEQRLLPLAERIKKAQQRMQMNDLAVKESERQQVINLNLQAATAAMIAGSYVNPPTESALFFFNKVLSLEPENETAKQGLVRISNALVAQVNTAISSNNFNHTGNLLKDLRKVDSNHEQLENLANDLITARTKFSDARLEEERLAQLQLAIDGLSKRISQWRNSDESLDAQSKYGDQLAADIADLLSEHSENSKLLTLYAAANQRLDELSALRQKEVTSRQKNQKAPVRKPIVGGF